MSEKKYYLEFMGPHGVGKTTLLEEVFRIFSESGLSVAGLRRLHYTCRTVPLSRNLGRLTESLSESIWIPYIFLCSLYLSLRIITQIKESPKKKLDAFKILIFNAVKLRTLYLFNAEKVVLHDWGSVGRLSRYMAPKATPEYFRFVFKKNDAFIPYLIYIRFEPSINASRLF